MSNPLSKYVKPAGIWLLVLMCAGLVLAACGDETAIPSPAALPTIAATPTPVPPTPALINPPPDFGKNNALQANLVGSGATFPDPVYQKWIGTYKTVAPGINIKYEAIGSGGGRKYFQGATPTPLANLTPTAQTDFGGTDSPFNGTEYQGITDSKGQIVHIPTVLGAVAVVVNLNGIESDQLKLTGPILADIFLGRVKNWNDAAIKALNPGLNLPAQPIVPVVREDNSGTTEIFKRYLSVISDDFRASIKPDAQNAIRFDTPAWEGVTVVKKTGNPGVVDGVLAQPGGIGYAEYGVAADKKAKWATISNKTGRFISPSNKSSVTDAASGVSIPDDFRIFMVNGDGDNTYPIVGVTWIVVWRDLSKMPNASPTKAQALANFLWWALHDGQSEQNLAAGYAPLPGALVNRLERVFFAPSGDTAAASRVLVYNGKFLPNFQ